MTVLVIGSVLLAVELAIVALAICSGNIPFLCRLLGGVPEAKETGHGIRSREIGRTDLTTRYHSSTTDW